MTQIREIETAGSLASQPSLLGKFQVKERPVSNTKVDELEWKEMFLPIKIKMTNFNQITLSEVSLVDSVSYTFPEMENIQ